MAEWIAGSRSRMILTSSVIFLMIPIGSSHTKKRGKFYLRDEFIRGSTLLKGSGPSLDTYNARLRTCLPTVRKKSHIRQPSASLLTDALPFSRMKTAPSPARQSLSGIPHNRYALYCRKKYSFRSLHLPLIQSEPYYILTTEYAKKSILSMVFSNFSLLLFCRFYFAPGH